MLAVTPPLFAVEWVGSLVANHLKKIPSDELGAVAFLLGQQNGELVAAETGQHIGLAQARLQGLSDPDDQVIPSAVALSVVVVLEVVQIDHQHRSGRPVPFHPRHMAGQLSLKASPVQQSG
jgi:hypothetical protein